MGAVLALFLALTVLMTPDSAKTPQGIANSTIVGAVGDAGDPQGSGAE